MSPLGLVLIALGWSAAVWAGASLICRMKPASKLAQRASILLGVDLNKEYTLLDLLKRPEMNWSKLSEIEPEQEPVAAEVAKQVEIHVKYAGYIDRQQEEIARLRRNENMVIPEGLDIDIIPGLSNEIMQKLKDTRPATLGQASRISGVTPAALSLLMIYLKKQNTGQRKTA